MKYLVRSNSAFIIALFFLLLVASPLFSPAMADEKKVTAPISQVVKTDKLSAEQLTKAEVTVPISWVREEYLEKKGITGKDNQESDEKEIAPNNIPDGTYKRKPKISSDQNDLIEISDFHFEFTYDQGDLRESTVNFIVTSNTGKIESVDLLLEEQNKLTPKDGSFDSTTEKFSTTLNDLIEGKLYRGKIEISTVNGSDTVEFEVYPRQFLNIADDDEINVGAQYYLWYKNPGHWSKFAFSPKCGPYDSRNDGVIAKHIDWATGHGIDFFLMGWTREWIKGWPRSEGKDWLDDRLNNFLQNPLADEIKYAFTYQSDQLDLEAYDRGEVLDFSKRKVWDKFIEELSYAADKYFQDDNYFKVHGKPFIYLWSHGKFRGPFRKAMKVVDQASMKVTRKEVYWVGQNLLPTPHNASIIKSVDATVYYMPIYRLLRKNGKCELTAELLDKWYTPYLRQKYFSAQDYGIDYIPEVVPGEDKLSAEISIIKRTAEGFKHEIATAKRMVDSDIKTLLVTSFNEWPESTAVEPGSKWGTEYLELIMEALESEKVDSGLIEKMHHIEFKFNKTVVPEKGHKRKLAVAFDWAKFGNSPEMWNPDLKVDIGTIDGNNYLGEGWFYNEKDPDSDLTFVWAGGSRKESSIYIPKNIKVKYMQFRANTGWSNIDADVYFNGRKVDHIVFQREMDKYFVQLEGN